MFVSAGWVSRHASLAVGASGGTSGAGVNVSGENSNSSTPQTDHSTTSLPPVRMGDRERRGLALQILDIVLASPVLQPHLFELLSAK